jgi:hypothetical protein
MKTTTLPKNAYRSVTIAIPEDVYRQYGDEESITDRVVSLAAHNHDKPICVSDKQRQTLDRLFNCNLNTPDDLLTRVRQMCSVRVAGVDVPLDLRLLTRLKTRCFSVDFNSWLATLVKQELERYAGMR